VRGWQTSLGILGHSASVPRDLWPLAMWLLKGKIAIHREDSIPEVAEWAAKEALKHELTASASSTTATPYAIIGSDASDSGWGAVSQTTALSFQTRVHALRYTSFRIYDIVITISNYQNMV